MQRKKAPPRSSEPNKTPNTKSLCWSMLTSSYVKPPFCASRISCYTTMHHSPTQQVYSLTSSSILPRNSNRTLAQYLFASAWKPTIYLFPSSHVMGTVVKTFKNLFPSLVKLTSSTHVSSMFLIFALNFFLPLSFIFWSLELSFVPLGFFCRKRQFRPMISLWLYPTRFMNGSEQYTIGMSGASASQIVSATLWSMLPIFMVGFGRWRTLICRDSC